MPREKRNSMNINNLNEHLSDVFSDDLYLELGSIDYEPLVKLLDKKLVDYKELSDPAIIGSGIGNMECSSSELNSILPFLKFDNIVNKNKSYRLVLTYGILLHRNGFRESFVPIFLIPVKMYFEDNTILFQMISKPIINPYIKNYDDIKNFDSSNDKIDTIYGMDKFIMNYANNHTNSIRSESYLTIFKVEEPEVNIHHEIFRLDSHAGAKLIDKYSVSEDGDIYNITPLDRSQRNAVAMASRGYSFAITGYEGTGKTTTLVNIASDAIKNGKRVLYVSNNDTTLKKVYEIFKEVDLHNYITSFTDSFNKVNEKVSDMRRGQALESLPKEELAEAYTKIESFSEKFAYKNHNYLLIEIMDELLLTPKPKEIFGEKIMKNAYNLYKYEIREVLKALEIIEGAMKNIDSFTNSHFINIPVDNVIVDTNYPMELIEKIKANYCILKEEKDILEKNYGFVKLSNIAFFRNKIKDYEKLNKLLIPSSWYIISENEGRARDKFNNFKIANNLFNKFKKEVLTYNSIEYAINANYYSDYIHFNVKKAIDSLTDCFFTIDDQNINNVLRDYEKLSNEHHKTLEYCNELESYYAKLKSRLGISINLDNIKIINEILDFIYVLDEGYFSKIWCDYENRDGILKKMTSLEDTLDKYEEYLKLYNKYFDNIINLESNIRLLERKRRDENSKYRGILIKDLLDAFYFLRKYHENVPKLKKEYVNLTSEEYKYKVKISKTYRKFMELHDKISDKNCRIQIEESFQDLRGSGIVDLLSLAKQLRKTILNVNVSYDNFVHYKLVENTDNMVSKIKQIKDIKQYIKNVVKYQKEMKNLLKDSREVVLFDSYLNLSNNLDALNALKYSINTNEQYQYLYDGLFYGEKTDIKQLENIITEFDEYLDIFKDASCLVRSFEPKYNNQIVIHLENAENIIKEIEDLFQSYVKIFKVNTSKYLYEDFKKMISYFSELLESKEELKTYLTITEQLRVLLKYKLEDLKNYIYQHNHEPLKNRFKYTYFSHMYKSFISNNEDFTDIKTHEDALDYIAGCEKDLLDSNVFMVKISNKIYRTGKSKHLKYNNYIDKNKGGRMLFLTDTVIANNFLNIDLFDLVIIDDAHMLSANNYYKVVGCKQVVIAGNGQKETSVHNNLISRLRTGEIIKFKYKYERSPLMLISQMENLTGRFYSNVKDNKGIVVSNDNYNAIIMDIFRKNPEAKINFFTSSLSIMHDVYKQIGSVLFDRDLSLDEMYNYFKYNLNVSDIQFSYSLNADYNIFDLHSYSEMNDEYTIDNIMNIILSCSKQLIIYDNKNELNKEKKSLLINTLLQKINYQLPQCVLRDETVINKISKSLSRFRIKTVGIYYPLHLVVEYENKYFGIMLFENPSNTEFSILNNYREFKSNDFPIVIVWLSNLVDNYDNTINEIVKEIRS